MKELGQPVFKAGLHRYLSNHSYGNAQTDDLWAALQQSNREAAADRGDDVTGVSQQPLDVKVRPARLHAPRQRSAHGWNDHQMLLTGAKRAAELPLLNHVNVIFTFDLLRNRQSFSLASSYHGRRAASRIIIELTE